MAEASILAVRGLGQAKRKARVNARTSAGTWRRRISIMAEDLIPLLTRFHREIVLPDIKRVVGELRDEGASLRAARA